MAYGVINSDLMTTSDGVSSAGLYGFKNKIINGAMVIDQRNAGASVTPTNAQYTVDRWNAFLSQASKFSVQQNAASVTPPVGFTKYLGITSLSAYSVISSDYFAFTQAIEGQNISDLAWGTANAAPITISFWVRSSLTGTFGGSICNSDGTRSYPFTYTISSANTWEQKSITIAGDTTGTWLTTNGIGLALRIGLGTGSTFSGTAGSWAAANYISATGATSVVGTSGATFYITGVQLEKGSTATSFDYRPYGTELALCQRYYALNMPSSGWSNSTTSVTFALVAPVIMRASPTVSLFNGTSALNDPFTAIRNISAVAGSGMLNTQGGYVDVTSSATTASKTQILGGSSISLSSEL